MLCLQLHFAWRLGAQGIAAEMFVYMPRKLGAWRDALFLEELGFCYENKDQEKKLLF
jgi:hypothetical protein